MADLPVLGYTPDPVWFERVGGASRSVETTKVIERIHNALPITIGSQGSSRLGSPEVLVVELERVINLGNTHPWLMHTWSVRGTRFMPGDEDELVLGYARFAWGVDELGEDNQYYKRAVAILDEYREASDAG
jgi:hypothetical protein